MTIDYFVFQTINGLAYRWTWLDNLAIFLAGYFAYVLMAILFIWLVKDFRKHLGPVFFGLLSAGFAWVFSQAVQFLLLRPRPFIDYSVKQLLTHPAVGSFPSGHAAFFFALSALFLFYSKKLGSLFLVGAVLISLSRVFVGLHWFSDVLAGLSVGFIIALIVRKLSYRFVNS